MTKTQFLGKIKKVDEIASASKLSRLLRHPIRYTKAIFFREFIYKRKKQSREVVTPLFFDMDMHILLPASTDIYLTGGKSHISEIKLARFLINHLEKNDTFLDVGAHYGYFSLLASRLVGEEGKVLAFEASPASFHILEKNQETQENMRAYHRVVSDAAGEMIFYEFPNLYSEYNTFDVSQFKNESWFKEYGPEELTIPAVVLDEFLQEEGLEPKIIKIDVEGAEMKVLEGLKQYLSHHSPLIAMEYLSEQRSNRAHRDAEKLLKSLGYRVHVLDNSGTIQPVENVSAYLKEQGLDSDNVVFVKKE